MAACFSFCQRQSSGNLYGATATNSTSEIERSNVMMIELEGHTMHGVFHCNGFGHLLCINGLESGSNLAGHHIMDFWDRLCTGLHARFVYTYQVSSQIYGTT